MDLQKPLQTPPDLGTTRHPFSYRMFRSFNAPDKRHLGGLKCRIDRRCTEAIDGTQLAVRFVNELADRRAIKLKEVFESFEFFARVRRRVRAPLMADLCCGHGLTGIVFAMFERSVTEVTLLDRAFPPSHRKVLDAAIAVAPWVEPKIRLVSGQVEKAVELLQPGTSVVAIHACGVRTDRSIEAAIALGGSVAVMPCCYQQSGAKAPPGLMKALGQSLATDVHRTYVLENAGYSVRWTGIPPEITAMNRVMVADRR
jgi:hypothetical protein